MTTQQNVKTKKQKKITAWLLFAGFFRIGAFTIGGGYAMIPIIQRDLVERNRWLEKEEFLDLIAAAQSIPGVITANTAAVVGYRLAGLKGALVSMLGAVLPSFLIILLIANFLLRFQDNVYVDNFLAGVRPAVVGLLFYAAFSLGGKALSTPVNWVLFMLALAALVIFNVHPIVVIVLAGSAGFFLFNKKMES